MTARAIYLLLTLAAGAIVLPAASAFADNNWKQSNALWRLMDTCTRAAQKQYPDHTPEAIAKRDQARRQCLRRSNLPGDADAPPSTAERH
jgi:hypothetical protein